MTKAATETPVDAANPGTALACLGIVEVAGALGLECRAAFRQDGRDWWFRCEHDGKPVIEQVMSFMDSAQVHTIAPEGSANSTDKRKIPTRVIQQDEDFPGPDWASPARLPAILTDAAGHQFRIDHWADGRLWDELKLWTGAGGYPGAGLLRDALDALRGRCRIHADDPWAVSAPMTSGMRLDWRRDSVPLRTGFSPHIHKKKVVTIGYPLVDVLAACGLRNARPVRRSRLEYEYALALGDGPDGLTAPVLLREAFSRGGPAYPGQPARRFRMHLEWAGREGDARTITHVTEIDADDRRDEA